MYVVDWGLGNYPNYIVILIYTAILNQRHRAFLHVCYLTTQLLFGAALQVIYA